VPTAATTPTPARFGEFARSDDVVALAALHGVVGLLFGGAVLLDAPARGWAVMACVVAYNVGLPLLAKARRRADWFALWAFLLPVSVFQVVSVFYTGALTMSFFLLERAQWSITL